MYSHVSGGGGDVLLPCQRGIVSLVQCWLLGRTMEREFFYRGSREKQNLHFPHILYWLPTQKLVIILMQYERQIHNESCVKKRVQSFHAFIKSHYKFMERYYFYM